MAIGVNFKKATEETKKTSVVKAICDCSGLTEQDKLYAISAYMNKWWDEEATMRVVTANNRFYLGEDGRVHPKEG